LRLKKKKMTGTPGAFCILDEGEHPRARNFQQLQEAKDAKKGRDGRGRYG